MVPPVDTTATGTAKFHVNPNGTLSYEIDVNNINQVVGVPIRLKDGTDLTELLNLYATVNQKSFTQSLGAVNGQLVSGVLTANKLDGPLFGRNITDLVSFFTNKSAYVIVRTTQHQQGEIQGQILPGGMNAAIIGVNKTAGMNATTGVNKTAGMNATTGVNKTAGMNATTGVNKTAGMNATTGVNKTAGMNATTGVNKTAGMNATTGVNKTAGMNATTGAGMICHYLAQSKALLCMPR